ncbi:MAG: Fe-S cluster assembly protein SufD [Acidobacteria bacterium]|nr:MAG: Fe-S cluster assembly protein SufD [Acidobacteriota bacterium]
MYQVNGWSPSRLADVTLGEVACTQLVFLNGHFSQELSSPGKLPEGVKAGSLASALDSDGGLLEEHLARYASYRRNAFTALNTAFVEDGAFVYLPKDAVVKEPIHLLFLSTASKDPAVCHPRNLIVAGSSAQATVIESYAGLEGGVYFTNAVTEIVTGEQSRIDHTRLQRESERAFHVATMEVSQHRDSAFASRSISIGGKLVRNDLNVLLNGEGCDCTLDGLYFAGGEQHVDNHTTIDHAKPHCSSRELYKGILDGKSTGVFNGKIIVRKDAQKTDARQTNNNLLLSEESLINTKPQLEILADDVKCTHGATIGQLDVEALFYLRTRGIGDAAARSLLTYAFASEIIGRIRIQPIQCRLDLLLSRSLSKGHETL